MRRALRNILHLGVKELRSLAADPILASVIGFAFTLGVALGASEMTQELRNTPLAIVDHDRSPLTRAIENAFYPPAFRPPRQVTWHEMDALLDRGEVGFALVFPPGFERDVKAGRRPGVQLNVDANNIAQAFLGATHIQAIVTSEVAAFLGGSPDDVEPPIALAPRVRFNPNLDGAWFGAVSEVINQITLLSIILVGAAFLREREHGTLEHLLVMPLAPFEIMLAKVWANALVVLLASTASLLVVVQGLLDVPIRGSLPLFFGATALYLFSTTAMGIFLGTLARSMPQLALLLFLTVMPLIMLSGILTPRESMPAFVRDIMLLAPTTHFVRVAQGILFRGAGWSLVWPGFAAMFALGAVYFGLALRRFRVAVTKTQV